MLLIFAIVGTISIGSSEGIQLEYIAIFLAVLFPGALVALNYEVLQARPRSTALRIYCAGIWHNAVVSLLEFIFSFEMTLLNKWQVPIKCDLEDIPCDNLVGLWLA